MTFQRESESFTIRRQNMVDAQEGITPVDKMAALSAALAEVLPVAELPKEGVL